MSFRVVKKNENSDTLRMDVPPFLYYWAIIRCTWIINCIL